MNRPNLLLLLGAVLMVMSVVVLLLHKGTGDNRLKIGGLELSFSTPALVFLAAGVGLVVFPSTQWWRNNDQPNAHITETQETLPIGTPHPTPTQTSVVSSAPTKPDRTSEVPMRQVGVTPPTPAASVSVHLVTCGMDDQSSRQLRNIVSSNVKGELIWNEVPKARYKESTLTFYHASDQAIAKNLRAALANRNLYTVLNDAERREPDGPDKYLALWMIGPACGLDVTVGE